MALADLALTITRPVHGLDSSWSIRTQLEELRDRPQV